MREPLDNVRACIGADHIDISGDCIMTNLGVSLCSQCAETKAIVDNERI